MKPAAARLFPLTLMLALALLTFWLERAARDDEPHPSLRRHDADYAVDNLRVVRYGSDGAVVSSLTARKMLHYPDDDSTEITLPRLIETRPGGPRTEVSAMRGALSQDGEEVFLYDNVLLRREATETRPEVRVETSALHFVRSRSLVRSEREVRISSDRQVISGRGLEYDLEAGRMALHEQVRGRFEATKKSP